MMSLCTLAGVFWPVLTGCNSVLAAVDGYIPPPVCICEFYPAGVADDEYVVLRSLIDDAIDLRGWSICDGEGVLAFKEPSPLAARESVVISFNSSSYFLAFGRYPDYSVGDSEGCDDIDVLGSFRLADYGDSITLVDADGCEVDYVPYGNVVPEDGSWHGAALSCPRKGEVLRRMPNCPDTDSASDWHSFREYRYGYTEHRPVSCNIEPGCLTGFVSPDCSLDVVLDRLTSADESIRLCTYELESTSVFEALSNALHNGVEVRVFVEGNPVGGMSSRQTAVLSALTAAGADVIIGAGNLREGTVKHVAAFHSKYIVIDDDELVILSENFVPDGLPTNEIFANRGWGVAIRCPELARYMGEVFDDDSRPTRPDTADWADDERFNESLSVPPERAGSAAPGMLEPLISSASAEVHLIVSPDCSVQEPFLCGLIDGATEVLVQQFHADMVWELPEPDGESLSPLLNSLLERLRNGASCRMLLDSSWYNIDGNGKVVDTLTAVSATESLNGTFRLISERSPITVMHNKGMVVDGAVSLVSSNNWVCPSFARNRELAAVVRSVEVARYFTNAFDMDWHPDISPPTLMHHGDVIVARGEWVRLSSECFRDDRIVAKCMWDIGCDGWVESRSMEISFLADLPGIVTIGLTVADAWGNEADTIISVRIVASPTAIPPPPSPHTHIGLAVPPILAVIAYFAVRRKRGRNGAASR